MPGCEGSCAATRDSLLVVPCSVAVQDGLVLKVMIMGYFEMKKGEYRCKPTERQIAASKLEGGLRLFHPVSAPRWLKTPKNLTDFTELR